MIFPFVGRIELSSYIFYICSSVIWTVSAISLIRCHKRCFLYFIGYVVYKGISCSIALSHLFFGGLEMKYWLFLVLEVMYVFHTVLSGFIYHQMCKDSSVH